MNTVGLFQTRVILGLPEFVIRDFGSFEFNGVKLCPLARNDHGLAFDRQTVLSFKDHLEAPWPGVDRIDPPKYVKRYVRFEAGGCCALCRHGKPNYQYAHVRRWSSTRCNSPHNLLLLCLDCHKTDGDDEKLLRGVKEEHIRRQQLVDTSALYVCQPDIAPGDAVYARNGEVFRAIATTDRTRLASGIVQTKIGPDRCTIQRTGVAVTVGHLVAGADYFLSPSEFGRVVTEAEFDVGRDISMPAVVQLIGRAEGPTELAIGSLGTDLTLRAGALLSKSR